LSAFLSRHGLFYGWWVVFACAFIVFLSAGTFFYGFGLLVGPLTDEFGWSRAAIAAAFSLRTEVGGVAAPIVGFAVDRVGVRRLTTIGVVMVAVGFILLSRVDSLLTFYVTIVFIAVGMSATGGPTASVAIAHWFRRNRGKALGLMTLGGGAGGLAAIIFAQLITSFGWRNALVIIGLSQLALCTPLALSIRDRPSDVGLQADGFAGENETPAQRLERESEPPGPNLTSREALRSVLFWKIALVFACSNFATTAIIVHQVPFLIENVGFSNGAAAASVTIMTAISIIGRLGLGGAADKYPKTIVMAITLACTAAGLALMATVYHPWQVIYALPLFGIGFGGAVPLRAVIQAEYFGLKAFGAIQGMVLTVTTVGAFIGPVMAGYLYDTSGSYRLAFLILAAAPLAAIPLVLSIRPAGSSRVERTIDPVEP
jgi:sugar phosphate permease